MNMIIKALLLAAMAAWTPAVAATSLTLLPTGNISGNSGSTIGWGFTIGNDMNFLEVTSSQYCLNPVNFPGCTPSTLGTFTDFIGFEPKPVVVGPSPESSSVTQMFNATMMMGVGSFKINMNAAPGLNDIGKIVLTYDLFTRSPNDPNFNPDTDTISTDNLLSAKASVTVSSVPEPATIGLIILASVTMIAAHRRRKSDRSTWSEIEVTNEPNCQIQ